MYNEQTDICFCTPQSTVCLFSARGTPCPPPPVYTYMGVPHKIFGETDES